jgi:hypothetical protein
MAFNIGLPKIHRTLGLSADTTCEKSSPDTNALVAISTLDDLPTEVLIEIVRADPDATFALLDTSHRYARAVLDGVLAALSRDLPEGKEARAYVKACLRAGRSAADLVSLSDILGERNSLRRVQWIEKSQIIPPRVRDALCKTLLQFLCTTPVLLEAFQMRRCSILIDDEIACWRRMLGINMPPELGREIWRIGGEETLLTGLDRVLLPFACQLGKEAIFEFCNSQYDYADMVYSNSGSQFVKLDRPVLATMVYGDAKRVGDSLLRYLSAEQVLKVRSKGCYTKHMPVKDGTFFPVVAGHEVEISVIDLGRPDLNYSEVAKVRQESALRVAMAVKAARNRRECCILS